MDQCVPFSEAWPQLEEQGLLSQDETYLLLAEVRRLPEEATSQSSMSKSIAVLTGSCCHTSQKNWNTKMYLLQEAGGKRFLFLF